jgi:hypothetical protein
MLLHFVKTDWIAATTKRNKPDPPNQGEIEASMTEGNKLQYTPS